MKAAIVERYWLCVRRKASISSSYVEGPEGKAGEAGLSAESAEVKEEDEDTLLMEGPCLCLLSRDSAGASMRGFCDCEGLSTGSGSVSSVVLRPRRRSPILLARAADREISWALTCGEWEKAFLVWLCVNLRVSSSFSVVELLTKDSLEDNLSGA